MNESNPSVPSERQLIRDARAQGRGALFKTYVRLSGPGWLQSAITLGGGSLAGSLYLGVIGGYQFMWLQPLMMLLGIVMLSAIGYVTLVTGERPFQSINRHINPVLGWGWLVAAMLANLVWAMPQFSLGTAALQQNLGWFATGGRTGSYLAAATLFAVSALVVWLQGAGGRGAKVFDGILKAMVGVVVVSFFGVVLAMSFSAAGLPWGEILRNFVPNLALLREPADGLKPFIAASGDPGYWTGTILAIQRDNMITAAATAVGINMTFLMPYSLLKRGWDREFTGLATFDLATGLFIPFLLATSCVVLAAGSQFHGKYDAGLLGEAEPTAITRQLRGGYEANLRNRLAAQVGYSAVIADAAELQARAAMLPVADRQLAAMLVQRDANTLANSLEKLTGKGVAQTVFGIGVLGMAVSTIIILMLINGFTVCEALGREAKGLPYHLGSLLPGVTGALGFLLLWGDAKARFWLAVPTSVFGMVLLPIAYITFFLMMNSRPLLGDRLPQGGRRVAINGVMLLAIAAAATGSLYSINAKAGTRGLIALAAFVALALIVQFARKRPAR